MWRRGAPAPSAVVEKLAVKVYSAAAKAAARNMRADAEAR